MRTTIRIDESLYRQLKSHAGARGKTVSELIEDAVRVSLQSRPEHRASLPPLPTFRGTGLMPGVDLADSAALRELVDEGRPLDALR